MFPKWHEAPLGWSDPLSGWRPPEELELDVVGVAKGEHGVPGVPGFLDSRVRDLEPVQSLGPFVEVFSAINQELQMIETRAELAEGLAGMLSVTNEAEDKLALRFHQSDVPQPTVLTCVVVENLEVQEF